MKGYGQFCPVAKAAEVFAERWTPLILRELLAGSHRFSEFQRGLPLISRTLLTRRLKELEDAGVIESRPRAQGRGREYYLTPAGEEFREIIDCLGQWGQRWVRSLVGPEDLDAGLLMWAMHRRVNPESLPLGRVTVQFDFRGVPRNRSGRETWWLVLTQREVDVCLKHPGFEIDLVVDADLEAFTRVCLGHTTLSEAVRGGLVSLQGPRNLTSVLPSWMGLSPDVSRQSSQRSQRVPRSAD
jgi:DNA-binding HxlR family transcriptional regulator